jgi:hypothetical protein
VVEIATVYRTRYGQDRPTSPFACDRQVEELRVSDAGTTCERCLVLRAGIQSPPRKERVGLRSSGMALRGSFIGQDTTGAPAIVIGGMDG